MGLNKAFARMGGQLAKLYRDRAIVWTVEQVRSDRGLRNQEVLLFEDIPCKLSLNRQVEAGEGVYARERYDAKIFLSSDYQIPTGAVVEVLTATGRSYRFKRASDSYGGYLSHQEVTLVREEKA